jgi:hypothetical protein
LLLLPQRSERSYKNSSSDGGGRLTMQAVDGLLLLLLLPGIERLYP